MRKGKRGGLVESEKSDTKKKKTGEQASERAQGKNKVTCGGWLARLVEAAAARRLFGALGLVIWRVRARRKRAGGR